MAGRPIKQGIDYFPLNTDFFQDVKVRKILRACGPNAVSVLICLLCNIYRDNGYYILWDEDLPFFIADEVGVSEGCVKEILLKAVQVGFFDVEKHSAYGILTSSGIQKRFLSITNRRTETVIKDEFLINVDNNSIIARRNSIIARRNADKVKERKKENSLSGEKESQPAPYAPDPTVAECRDELRRNQPWLDQFSMNLRSAGYPDITRECLLQWLDRFFAKLQNEGVTRKSAGDAQHHFANWLKIELEKQKHNGNPNRHPYPSKQEANDYALHALQERMEQRRSGLQDELPKPF